jgi:pimeloyl-ACP methyl ester carboxylesterase
VLDDLHLPAVDLEGVEDLGEEEGYRRLRLATRRGSVAARLYAVPGAQAAVLCVGGVGGGFDSPARNLYVRLGESLPREGIAVLRVRFRNPTDLDEAVHDVRAGLRALAQLGVHRVGLVGHSFGGAVVIQAGVVEPAVAAVVTLATQSHGTEEVGRLAPRPLLLIHGTDDAVLPTACSVATWQRAGEPKSLQVVEGAGHVLDEAAQALRTLVQDWLRAHLAPGMQPAA